MSEPQLQSMSGKTSNDTSLRVQDLEKVAANENAAIILTVKEEEELNMFEDSLSALMIRKKEIKDMGDDITGSLSWKTSLQFTGMVTISFYICFALLDPRSHLKSVVILFLSMVFAISYIFSFTIRSFKGRYNDWKEQDKKLQRDYFHYLKLARQFVADLSNRSGGNEILLENNEIKMPKTGRYLMAGIEFMPVRYRMDMLVDDSSDKIWTLSKKSEIIFILVTHLVLVLLLVVLAVSVLFTGISNV